MDYNQILIGSSMIFFGSSIMKTLINASKNQVPDKFVHINLFLGSMCLITNGTMYIYQSI